MATARSSLKLSFFTIISRILGLVRDYFLANFFGTGVLATIWEIAYLLPNMLRNLLAEGVLSQAFQPVYSEDLRISKDQARQTAGVVIAALFLVLLVLVLAGVILFPVMLPAYARLGGKEAELLVQIAQVMFVFILTASLTAIFAGISNAHLLFTFPALSPIILNLVFIVTFLYLAERDFTAQENLKTLSWSVVFGGFLQLFVQALYIRQKGLFPVLRLIPGHPALKKIMSLMAPAVLGAGMFQINQLSDIFLAGYFISPEKDPVPTLRYAHRLIQLPTGIVGVAVATVILPALLRHLREQRKDRTQEELAQALGFAAFLTLPAFSGLFFLRTEIIDLLFSGGAWKDDSTRLTAFALLYYTPGVVFFSWNKILTSSFFAFQDTRTPVRIMVRVLLVNFCLNLVLVQFLDQAGLALSSSLCALLNTFLLLHYLKRKMPVSFKLLWLRLQKHLPASLLLCIYLYVLLYFKWQITEALDPFLTGLPLHSQRLQALAIILPGAVGGLVLYLAVARLLRIPEFIELLNRNAKTSR